MSKFSNKLSIDLKSWAEKKYLQLAVFNIFLVFLVLLKSAGYFDPYFPITINSIVVLGILASIILLKVDSKAPFTLAIIFWFFTALFRVLNIIPWAERMAIYAYESFAIGVIQYLVESLTKNKKRTEK